MKEAHFQYIKWPMSWLERVSRQRLGQEAEESKKHGRKRVWADFSVRRQRIQSRATFCALLKRGIVGSSVSAHFDRHIQEIQVSKVYVIRKAFKPAMTENVVCPVGLKPSMKICCNGL